MAVVATATTMAWRLHWGTGMNAVTRREVRTTAAYRSWETRREREQAVTVNVPADMLPLWERTKLQFKGTPAERLEAFLAYAHDHNHETIEAVIDEADAKLEAMIREYQGRAA